LPQRRKGRIPRKAPIAASHGSGCATAIHRLDPHHRLSRHSFDAAQRSATSAFAAAKASASTSRP
jgi:hypothetical protein